jgi:hypothetical protein
VSQTLAAAPVRTRVDPAGTPGAPQRRSGVRLRVVTPPAPVRTRTPFVLLCAGVLIGGLLGLLMLNITLSRGAYDRHALTVQSANLSDAEQALSQQVALAAAPQRLEERARSLGMVPAENPAFLRLSDGTVLGVPGAAQPELEPTVDVPLAGRPEPADGEGEEGAGASADGAAAGVGTQATEQAGGGDEVPADDGTGVDGAAADDAGGADAEPGPAAPTDAVADEPTGSGALDPGAPAPGTAAERQSATDEQTGTEQATSTDQTTSTDQQSPTETQP